MSTLETRIAELSPAKRRLLELRMQQAGISAPKSRAGVGAPARRARRPTRTMPVAELAARARLDEAIGRRCVRAPHLPARPSALLLTGATGFLGAFLLDELLRRTDAEIHCLVRATSPAEGLARIRSNLTSYLLDDAGVQERVVPVVGDLAKPLLGLHPATFRALAARVDAIHHCGAVVKWTYPYRALEPANVGGTREILRLATTPAAPRAVHFISTVGVFSSAQLERDAVDEAFELERSGPLAVGYAQTKWVSERMVRSAAEHGLPVTIHRPSIGADSRTGAFNRHDHLCLAVAGAAQLGCAPDSAMPVQIAPVDYVARATVQLALHAEPRGQTYHLVNDRALSWSELFDLVDSLGFPLERMALADWTAALAAQARAGASNAVLGLLPFLADALDSCRLPTFECERTRAALAPAGIACPPIGTDLLQTYLERFIVTGWLAGQHDVGETRVRQLDQGNPPQGIGEDGEHPGT